MQSAPLTEKCIAVKSHYYTYQYHRHVPTLTDEFSSLIFIIITLLKEDPIFLLWGMGLALLKLIIKDGDVPICIAHYSCLTHKVFAATSQLHVFEPWAKRHGTCAERPAPPPPPRSCVSVVDLKRNCQKNPAVHNCPLSDFDFAPSQNVDDCR